jgi:hypothetical protein
MKTTIENVKIDQFLQIGKHKMKVNRHSRDNWRSEKEHQKMIKAGNQELTVWGTIEFKGIPYCACAMQDTETKNVELSLYKEPDPGYCFIGGEGSYVENGKLLPTDEYLRKEPNSFAYHKNFKYGDTEF